MAKVLLGQAVKDIITGFSGVVTGRVEYLTGCNQVLVAPKVGKEGGWVDACWLDEQRVKVLNKKRVTLDNRTSPGFDKAAPKR